MMRMAVFVAGAVVAGVMAGPASASRAEREQARLIMFDDCVIGSATNDNAGTDFAETCRCASKKASRKLTEEQIEGVIAAGKLRGQSVAVWNEIMAGCKKS